MSDYAPTTNYFHVFSPQPDATELPSVMPSPFSGARPHALAIRAMEELKSYLATHAKHLPHDFSEKHRGKMFGVLVVEASDGTIGYIKAFSGLLGEHWLVSNFVPPIFDLEALESFWPNEKEEIYRLNREIDDVAKGTERQRLSKERAHTEASLQQERRELEAQHSANKRRRDARRLELQAMPVSPETKEALAKLSAESWDEKNARKRLRRTHRLALDTYDDALAALDRRREALTKERAQRCSAAQEKILACYLLENFLGEQALMASLFAPHPPSGGAGDCAAPKLLAHAQREKLRPIALAEFWWGRGSAGGERHHGAWYPFCRSKCEPILPWMLRGVAVEPPPMFGAADCLEDEPTTVYEDDYLAIVNKPAGMLSVPGRNVRIESVQSRLETRYPKATGPLLVHRLDLDTSGLLVMAKTLDVYRLMQRLFSERRIEKEYLACLDGVVEADEGIVSLPLRLDYHNRPRQIVDKDAGKPAITRWRVIRRDASQTRIAFFPETGRTHQLRVHAAHPAGLSAPIVGDPLYGRADTRMMLHARSLRFIHPITGQHIEVSAPAPF